MLFPPMLSVCRISSYPQFKFFLQSQTIAKKGLQYIYKAFAHPWHILSFPPLLPQDGATTVMYYKIISAKPRPSLVDFFAMNSRPLRRFNFLTIQINRSSAFEFLRCSFSSRMKQSIPTIIYCSSWE